METKSNKSGRFWIMAGALIDLAGAALIVRSLSDGGPWLAAGIGAVLAGSLLVFRGVLRVSQSEPSQGHAARRPRPAAWEPEPELRQPPPRPARLTATARWMAVLWILTFAVAVWFFLFRPGGREPVPPLLATEGVSTTATIHRQATRQTPAGGTTFYLYYNFTDDSGGRVRSSMSVSERVYRSRQVGDSVEVIYLPGSPATHFVPELAERPRPRWLVWAIIGALGCLAALADSQRRRHKKLVVLGTAARGVVGPLSRRGSARVFPVHYSVHGEERTLRVSERNAERREGDVLTVLYLPDQQHALAYCASLYRAVDS